MVKHLDADKAGYVDIMKTFVEEDRKAREEDRKAKENDSKMKAILGQLKYLSQNNSKRQALLAALDALAS